MKLPAAAVAVALTVAACGGGSSEPVAASTCTGSKSVCLASDEQGGQASQEAMQESLAEQQQTSPETALAYWRSFDRPSQDTMCDIWLSPGSSDDNELNEHMTSGDYSMNDMRAMKDVALPTCERRQAKAEAKARAKAERQAERERKMRERQHKIDAMTSDSSLTANQKVAVYDAVCEYLTQPGEANLFDLSERAIAALPQGSTPQQQWDASVDAGWLMGSGACR